MTPANPTAAYLVVALDISQKDAAPPRVSRVFIPSCPAEHLTTQFGVTQYLTVMQLDTEISYDHSLWGLLEFLLGQPKMYAWTYPFLRQEYPHEFSQTLGGLRDRT